LIATPLLALIRNMFAVVEANGFRVPSFQTNVLSCKAWAYFPAANEYSPAALLSNQPGIVA
jgi:hypothetical protein